MLDVQCSIGSKHMLKPSGDKSPWESRENSRQLPTLPWLSRRKITIPNRVAGYIHRSDLLNRILPTEGRLTILTAPGGFGKTTLLAESCRSLQDAGVLTAWVTLDENDTQQSLDAYLACSFQHAGPSDFSELNEGGDYDRPLQDRTASLINKIERHGTPCVLAVDELERICDPSALDLLNFLLEQSPPNLHIAIACREIPAGLTVAPLIFEGIASIYSTEDLRFSKSEIARFFGLRRSRAEIASLVEQTKGWPIAMRVLQNERVAESKASNSHATDVTGNWLESRLWRDISDRNRELMLDVGLFEWFDEALLDEVLEDDLAMRRVLNIPSLTGLLERVSGSQSDVWRLHPLVRDQCAKQRFRNSLDRFRSLHRRIAQALARRGDIVTAAHHAADAGDTELVAEILKDLGGMQLFLREGTVRLQTVDALLTEEMMEAHPRLALAHCVVLIVKGRLGEARRKLRAIEEQHAISALDAVDDDIEFQVDACNVRGMLMLYACDGLNRESTRAMFRDQRRFAKTPNLNPLIRSSVELGLCIYHNMRAEFDRALQHAERAEEHLDGNLQMRAYVDIQRGEIAMARGRVSEAINHYSKARCITKSGFLLNPGPTSNVAIFVRELDFERNRILGIETTLQSQESFAQRGVPFATHAAFMSVNLELTSHIKGIDKALSIAEEMLDHASGAGLSSIVRCLTGFQINLLVANGQIGDAEEVWQSRGLPERLDACLDLTGQTWREMEALACAKLRLLIARKEIDAGRRFADKLFGVVEDRKLRRTWMRGLSLAIALEHSAGNLVRASAHMDRFLNIYEETDYAWSLVQSRKSSLPTLEAWIQDNRKSSRTKLANRLLGLLDHSEKPARAAPMLTARETEILQLIGSSRDRQIAEAMDISEAGVRYHIGKIFEKLSVRGRRNAEQRARKLGLIS